MGVESIDRQLKLVAAQKKKFEEFDELYDIQDEDVWDINPGGLLPVFMSNMPKYVEIPALHSLSELEGKSGAMQKILLGIDRADSEKPYKVYQHVGAWPSEYGELPASWRSLVDKLFV